MENEMTFSLEAEEMHAGASEHAERHADADAAEAMAEALGNDGMKWGEYEE